MSDTPTSLLGDRLRPQDILPMLGRSWWLALLSVGLSVAIALLVVVFSPREYRAAAVIRIVPGQGQEVQAKEVMDLNNRGFQEVERFYRTQVQLFKSRSFADKVATAYTERTGDEISAGHVLRGLEVYPVERSELVQVAIVDTDPQRAADLANLAAETFVAENIAWRKGIASDANKWVVERIAEMERRRAAAVTRLLTFKAEHNIIEREDAKSLGVLGARLDSLEANYGRIAAERVLLEARLDAHERLLRSGDVDALAAIEELPVSPSLRVALADTKARFALASGVYGEKHPEHIRARAALDQVRRSVEFEVRDALRSERARLRQLVEQESRLASERDLTKDQVLEQQRLDAEYRELQRLVGQIEESHRTLLKRRDELEMVAESRLNNAMTVDTATAPTSFIRPRIALTLAAGFVVGVLFGLFLALLRGLLDETILIPHDVESFISLPLLGVIPRIDASTLRHPELLAFLEPRSSVAEATRGVRTMLEKLPTGEPTRRLLVTSCTASEGKTSVAVQLGIVFAQQGRRVALLEGDHRRPRLHKVFDLDLSVPGMNDVLAGDRTVLEVVSETLVPGLFVVTRGSRAHMSLEVLSTDAMAALLDEVAEHFDIVILDTPPSAGLADAVTLSRMVDMVVIVARAGRVTRSLLRYTVRRFEQAGSAVRGVVLNDVDNESLGGRYYYYRQQSYYYQPSEGDEAAK
jgi:capsular exopolysaccharide synthesis family protein